MRRTGTLAISLLLMPGCAVGAEPPPAATTVEQRVERFFGDSAKAAASKESLPSAPVFTPVRVDRVESGGIVFSLWLSGAYSGTRSRCVYLDEDHGPGHSGGFGGCGSGPTAKLSLSGNDELVIGVVDTPAVRVRVTSSGGQVVEAPVVDGYFLVPPSLTRGVDERLSFGFLSADGVIISEVRDREGSPNI